jgi:endonuclease YncB( thermonuclease family)
MEKILLFLPAILSSFVAPVAGNYGSFNNVEYVRNYDGDTITVNISGVHDIIGKEMPIRLAGIDTPELIGLCPEEIKLATEARDFVTGQLSDVSTLNLLNIERGKYFRIIADVEYDNKDLATLLLDNGFAVEYEGGERIDWCEYLNQTTSIIQ